jgi:hypothetical protein
MEKQNDNKKTIWKNKIFRNDISSNSKKNNENIDILKMEEKIKKINKRKKYKENFKNIETLDNIYEEKEEEEEKTENKPETFQCASSLNEKEDLSNEEEFNDFEDILEGFIEGARGKRRKRKKSKKNKKGGKKYTMVDGIIMITNVFFTFYQYTIFALFYLVNNFDSFMTTLSKTIVDFSSDTNIKQEKDSDSKTLKHIFYNTLSFPLCIFITYNWFFLIAYADETSGCKNNNYGVGLTGNNLCRPSNDEKRFTISFDKIGYYKNAIEFFFGYSIMPLFYVDKILLGDNYIPYYFSMIESKNIRQFIILFFSFFLIFSFGKLGFLSSSIILIHYIFDLINEFIPTKSTDESSKNPNFMLKEVFGNKFGTFLAIGYFIIYWVIKLIIAVFSISLANILITIFIQFHSLFGMFLYGKDSLLEKMTKIDDYVKSDLKNFLSDNDNCAKPDFWKTLGKFIVDVFYKNKYSILYIFILVLNAFSINSVYSMNLKWIIGFIIGIQGFAAGEFIVSNILKTYDTLYNKNK